MKIYIAHALTHATEEFRQRMFRLRDSIGRLPGARILKFNWIPGQGPDPTVNSYDNDIQHVIDADLVVVVRSEFKSEGLPMEIQKRCECGKPLLLFSPRSEKIASIVPDCIASWRKKHASNGIECELYDPLLFDNDQEIINAVQKWIALRNKSTYIENPVIL